MSLFHFFISSLGIKDFLNIANVLIFSLIFTIKHLVIVKDLYHSLQVQKVRQYQALCSSKTKIIAFILVGSIVLRTSRKGRTPCGLKYRDICGTNANCWHEAYGAKFYWVPYYKIMSTKRISPRYSDTHYSDFHFNRLAQCIQSLCYESIPFWIQSAQCCYSGGPSILFVK